MKVSLRRILKKDWNYILNLRNNDKFRENFYQQHKISKTEHFEYLNKQKSNPNFFNWIICYGKNDVGYIRILDNDVSIIIDEKFHNRDIGSKSLKLLETEAKSLGITKLVGRVMYENKSSKKIFQKNNYKLKMYWLEKEI
jgi:RimJ/RimL family protein N-acetyltransferase